MGEEEDERKKPELPPRDSEMMEEYFSKVEDFEKFIKLIEGYQKTLALSDQKLQKIVNYIRNNSDSPKGWEQLGNPKSPRVIENKFVDAQLMRLANTKLFTNMKFPVETKPLEEEILEEQEQNDMSERQSLSHLGNFSRRLRSMRDSLSFMMTEPLSSISPLTPQHILSRGSTESEALTDNETVDIKEDFDSSEPEGSVADKNDFYTALAILIELANESNRRSVTENFQDRLDKVLSSIQGVLVQARESEADDIEQKKKLLQEIKNMLLSLRALSKSRSQYTLEYFEMRMKELFGEPSFRPEMKELANALRDVVDKPKFSYIYDGSNKKRTPFNANQGPQKFPNANMRLKIEHTGTGDNRVVTGTFSFKRNKVLGKEKYKFWQSRENEYKNFREQIKDFVDIAVGEYKKGLDPKSPIYITYTGSKKPEMALAVLMEFKKRAILEQRTYYAKNNEGKEVEITPDLKFKGKEEEKYFLDFANERPELDSTNKPKKSSTCAGYKLLAPQGIKVEKNSVEIGQLEVFLEKETEAVKVERELKSTAAASGKRPHSPSK